MNNSFETALQARLLWIDVRCCVSIGLHVHSHRAARKASQLVEDLAKYEARHAERYGGNIPPLLDDVPQLADLYVETWRHESMRIEDELEAAEEKRAAVEEASHRRACIERDDWAALSLPTPEALSAHLYTGQSIVVDQHFLIYEEGFVWMDTPYGVESGLGNEPTLEVCRSFLETVGMGDFYGPEP